MNADVLAAYRNLCRAGTELRRAFLNVSPFLYDVSRAMIPGLLAAAAILGAMSSL